MTFLNASLIFGIAAVSIPIVLHLIARREPRKVVFPSIRLLTKKFESNRSRMRVRRWWLLALRIAAIAAFAAALARPAIDRSMSVTWLTIGLVAALGVALLVMATVAISKGQSRSLVYGLSVAAAGALLIATLWGGYTYASGPNVSWEAAQPVSIAIVLDNSPTSGWKSPDDDRIARMQDLAIWMVTRLPATSRIAIVDRSAQPPAFALDVSNAINKIEQIGPLQVTQPLAARVDAAARLVRTSDLNNRQVLVVSDLAATSWKETVSDTGLSALLSETPAVNLTVFDLGTFEKSNRTLTTPKLADKTPPSETAIPITTTLQLVGGDDTSSLSVTAELELYENDPSLPVIRDGQVKLPRRRSVDRTSVRVAPGGSSNLLLTIPPLSVGTHHGRIRLIGDDPLAVDDQRYFSLRVMKPQPLLMFAEDADEARVMELAISDEFAVELIAFADLPVVRLADYPAIMMIDPPRDVLEDESLAEYVRGGGRLLVSLGPSAGEEAFTPPGMPNIVRRWRAADPGTFFQMLRPSHPLLAPLAEITGGVPWSGYRVHQYWQIDPAPNDVALMRYAGTEHPAILERIESADGGRQGRWLTLTTPVPALAQQTRRWNELFSGSEPWPAFLLVRQFAEYLTDRGDSGPMSMVGEPQVFRVDPPPQVDGETPPTRRLQLFPPDQGAPVPLEVAGDKDQVVFGDVDRAGTYWLRGLGNTEGFSANLSDAATGLERIAVEDLDQAFGPDGYTLAAARDDIELAESESETRVLLHSPMLLLALLVFLLEQVLGNRFYRGRAGAPGSANAWAPAA